MADSHQRRVFRRAVENRIKALSSRTEEGYFKRTGWWWAAVCLALAALTIGPFSFWPAVALFCAAICIFALDVLFIQVSWKLIWRIFLALLIVSAGAVALKYTVFVPAYFTIYASSKIGDYPDGTLIDGITWQRGMSELRIHIENDSDYDYGNLDVSFYPNELVRSIAQVRGPTVHFLSIDPTIRMEMMDVREDGTKHDSQAPVCYTKRFRIVCDSKFPRHSRIEILVATGHSPASTPSDLAICGEKWGQRTPTTQLGIDFFYTSLLGKPHRGKGGVGVEQTPR